MNFSKIFLTLDPQTKWEERRCRPIEIVSLMMFLPKTVCFSHRRRFYPLVTTLGTLPVPELFLSYLHPDHCSAITLTPACHSTPDHNTLPSTCRCSLATKMASMVRRAALRLRACLAVWQRLHPSSVREATAGHTAAPLRLAPSCCRRGRLCAASSTPRAHASGHI